MKAKIATIGLSLAFVMAAAAPVGAVTVADLQAQINALMAQLAALQGGSTASAAAAINSDLTIGSTGADVTSLQSALVSQGYLVMPAGVSMGYFGALTKAAVMKWQAANGVPATGFFGPISRAKFNASASATGTVPGTTVGTGTTVGGSITTPGVEGTLTVSKYPSPASGTTFREGATKVPVLGIKLEAKTSDIRVERVKLDLGTNTTFYRKIASKVYIMDGSTVLASSDLNADTVVKDGTDYYITIAGFGYIVPKDSTKALTVALDAQSTIDSTYIDQDQKITVPVDGVRGTDGAGINQYGPGTAFSNTFTPKADVASDATLTVSTNSATPQNQAQICTSGSDQNECSQIELLRADFKADKDDIKVTDLTVNLAKTGTGTATATVAYIYDGSTLIGSDTVENFAGATSTTFSDIDWTVPAGSTKTLTFKLDATTVNGAVSTFTASTSAALGNITAENSNGDTIGVSGSAIGNSVSVRDEGLQITLLDKSISKDAGGSFSGATSSLTATFKVHLTAVGTAVEFGNTGSTTYALADNDNTLAGGESFVVYAGGSVVHPLVSSSTTMTLSTTLPSAGTNSYSLGEGNSVDATLTYVMQGKDSTGTGVAFGSYAVGLERLNWLTLDGGRQTSTFMSGDSNWRTSTVTMP